MGFIHCYLNLMPRKAILDAPGALHHIIVKGIERSAIFWDDTDRDNLLNRLAGILRDSQTCCFAWSLMSNHYLGNDICSVKFYCLNLMAILC